MKILIIACFVSRSHEVNPSTILSHRAPHLNLCSYRISVQLVLNRENLTIETDNQCYRRNQYFHYHKFSESCFYIFTWNGLIKSDFNHSFATGFASINSRVWQKQSKQIWNTFIWMIQWNYWNKFSRIIFDNLIQFQRNDFMTCPSKFPWIQFPQCHALQWTSFERFKVLTGNVRRFKIIWAQIDWSR